MKKIELVQQEHTVKVGDVCGDIEPNIVEDTMFMVEGEPIGFYISDLNNYSEKAVKFADIANKELRSENVPKSTMRRDSGGVDQYSTIIGSIVPKPHMRRP